MARQTYIKGFLIYATILSLTDGLTLPNMQTQKPRHTKFSSSTIEPGSGTLVTPTSATKIEDDSGVGYYRVINSETGTTCTLLKTDGLVEVKYKLHGLEEQADSFIPEKALVDGSCDDDESTMTISWRNFNLAIFFSKTPGGERWYISNILLTVSPDLPQLHGIPTGGKPIKLYQTQKMVIPTPVGRSYSCDEVNIDLMPRKEDHPPEGLQGSLSLRLLQVQPFMYKGENFESPFECKLQKQFRSETAPIAVGSTLAVAVLVTVTGYGIFRYFKIKNVQYNTME